MPSSTENLILKNFELNNIDLYVISITHTSLLNIFL